MIDPPQEPRERGPFDEILEPGLEGGQDRSASVIFIGMGAIGLILLLVVVNPFSIFGGGDGGGGLDVGDDTSSLLSAAPKVPDGYEALSRHYEAFADQVPEDTAGPAEVTVPLLQPVSDGRNLGLYTFRDGNWERLASATLVNNGAAAKGEVGTVPDNIAVLRLTSSAVQISGWLPAGAAPDGEAMGIVTTVNPVDFAPAPDGTLSGSAREFPQADGNIVPTIRASTPEEADAVNAILASPALREEHIQSLVQLALQPGNAGVDIDYPAVNRARNADFTAFVTVLADQLHQANRTLSVALPTPVRSGVSWDTGAYDWSELGQRADLLKLRGVDDPSVYYQRMPEVFDFLRDKVDLKKVALIVSRSSWEKASDGLREISLHDGLRTASAIEVRTPTQITANTSVVIVGTNIYREDGASGMQWDDNAFAVSFSYPGIGGQRTVWLENSLSLAFRLDLARSNGLAGVAIADIGATASLPAYWEPLRTFAESGQVPLARANTAVLEPLWEVQAGSQETESAGNIIWKAPAQPGSYEVSLVVSDGVIRAKQTITLQVGAVNN
ncbi:MAG TPA: hypothetical protein VFS30_02380 [Dehalococcoidia bacterium]|nr:hypothetical protein [Dehalococcoidia bacterium]